MEEEIQERMQYLNEYAECPEKRQDALWCVQGEYETERGGEQYGARRGSFTTYLYPPNPCPIWLIALFVTHTQPSGSV
jgi:hypothetical protein